MASFRDLGLSSYEEKVYRTLLERGAATAEELSAESDVPMGRIYDVLNGLESRDLVRCNRESHPRVYAPIDSETAIDRLLRERKRDLEVERTRYENAAAELRSQVGGQQPVDGRFWETRTRDTETAFIHGQIERFAGATDEVLIVGDTALANQFRNAAPAVRNWIESIRESTVRVRILLSDELSGGRDRLVELVHGDEKPTPIETRVHPSVAANFDLIDRDELYLYVTDPFTQRGPLGTVRITESNLIEALEDEFDERWQEAETIQDGA
ncbi:TrmB family transcriptional regulator [Natronolimnohabitans innermongolicus]|nr:helix-turn-helix domain-containing protein [Natronolimnohabitans innermongolicus]